jgi:ABC-type bacteriocin/lantibiotic exporter with double-glycine peptidase domain
MRGYVTESVVNSGDLASMAILDCSSQSLIGQLAFLAGRLTPLRKWQLLGVVLLAFACSTAEVASIGVLYNFLAILNSQELDGSAQMFTVIQRVFPMLSNNEPILEITAALVVTLVFAASLRFVSTWANARLTEVIGVEVSADVFRRTVYQPYLCHVSRNSSEIVAALTGKVGTVFSGVIAPTLLLIQSIIVAAIIVLTLLVANWVVASLMMVVFGLLYGIIIVATKEKLFLYGIWTSEMSNEIIKLLQESLGGIRDVLTDNSQELYCRQFNQISAKLRRVQANIMIVSNSPSNVIVTLGMIVLSVVGAYMSVRDKGSSNALPLLGVFALGTQRLLPMLQQGYSCWSAIHSSRRSFADVLALMDQPAAPSSRLLPEALPFTRSIELEGVSFRYPGRDTLVLRNTDLRIARGQKVGIFGVTGGGKSTLMDVLMGLLLPTTGNLKVDGVVVGEPLQIAWRRNVAHVPQMIYLTDGSVLENIALGVPFNEIDIERVMQAARGAQLSDTVASWPERFHTRVGERGVRLSGGQRQRIGIARALYKQASVVVFDEATSALDSDTEKGVIEVLNTLGPRITLFMIAHRISTLEQCDVIYEIANGRVVRSGTYKELFS